MDFSDVTFRLEVIHWVGIEVSDIKKFIHREVHAPNFTEHPNQLAPNSLEPLILFKNFYDLPNEVFAFANREELVLLEAIALGVELLDSWENS